MQYTSNYPSPLGEILLAADEIGLIGLWFVDQKNDLDHDCLKKENWIIKQAKEWLDLYFCGQEPNIQIPLHFTGTDFQNEVWEILYTIPYGKTMTYGDIANQIAKKKGILRMSSQAVGSAIGKNKISIIVPCHRVVGSSGNLTGYAGGLDRKIALLKLEKAYQEAFFLPRK